MMNINLKLLPRRLLSAWTLAGTAAALSACGGSDEIPRSAAVNGKTYSVRAPLVQFLNLGSGDGIISGAPIPLPCNSPIYVEAALAADPLPVDLAVRLTKLSLYRSSGALLWIGNGSQVTVQQRADGALTVSSQGCSLDPVRGGESVFVVFDIRSQDSDILIRSANVLVEEVR